MASALRNPITGEMRTGCPCRKAEASVPVPVSLGLGQNCKNQLFKVNAFMDRRMPYLSQENPYKNGHVFILRFFISYAQAFDALHRNIARRIWAERNQPHHRQSSCFDKRRWKLQIVFLRQTPPSTNGFLVPFHIVYPYFYRN